VDVVATRKQPVPPAVRIDRDTRISIRPIERSDASGLSDFYAALSPESKRRRFLGQVGRSDHALADAFTERAGEGLVAILGEAGPADGAVVGHATIHPDGDGSAEVAVAVADGFQGRGIGSALVGAAVSQLHGDGLTRLTASFFADSVPMRRLLRAVGPIQSDQIHAGTEEITVQLAATRPSAASAT